MPFFSKSIPDLTTDDLAELLGRVGVLKERLWVPVDLGAFPFDQIAEIRRENRVIEVAFEDFIPWLASREHTHEKLLRR